MKRNIFFLAMLAIILAFGMTVVGCDNDSTDDNGGTTPQTATYTGTSSGTTYTLIITDNTAYVLTLTGTGGTKTSSGTVTVNGSTFTLKPSNAETTFTATVSGSSLTALNGTITYTDNTTAAAPGELGGGVPPIGEGGTLTVTNIPSEYNGKYAFFLVTVNGTNAMGAQTVSGTGYTLIQIANGSVTLPLWYGNSGTITRYTGSGTSSFAKIFIHDNQVATMQVLSSSSAAVAEFNSVTFSNGNASISWSNTSGGGTPPNPGEGGTFTLTGIPSTHNGKYAVLVGSGINLAGAQSIDIAAYTATLVPISNGSVSLPLWALEFDDSLDRFTNAVRYSGNDTVSFGVFLVNQPTYSLSGGDNSSGGGAIYFNTVAFASGSATRAWSQNDGIMGF